MKITLPVPPSANRWHRTINGRPILSREARLYTRVAMTLAMAQKVQCIHAPTEVEVAIVWYRQRKSGDVDKRGAIMLDALQGIAYDNDSQIRRYSIERYENKQSPRMEIEITEAA